MGAPQIIIIVLMSVGLLLNAHMHGKPMQGKFSIWAKLINTAATVGLLIWGGFFK